MPVPVVAGAAFLSRVAGIGQAGGSALSGIRDNMPTLEDEVTVEVVGQPGNNKQQLYFLALATANGMITKMNASLTSLSGSYGMLMIEYDAANDWVRCTLRYKWGMANANVLLSGALSPIFGQVGRFNLDNLVVYRGPPCNVVGGVFDFTADGLPGLPASSKPRQDILNPSLNQGNGPPILPFAGQMILTPCPTTPTPNPAPVIQNPAPEAPRGNVGPVIVSPNPKPPGDNRSRGSIVTPGQSQNPGIGVCCSEIDLLIPLVYAALSAPATNAQMTFPNPTPGPTGG